MPIIKEGDKYNKLTAVKFHHKDKHGNQYWLFKCDCGNEKVICVSDVKRGHTKSCARKKITHFTHGKTHSKIYNVWASMKYRCLDKNNKYYKDYGGRGITVCKEWLKFENFYKDMGDKPEGKSLDRIDNNGNYCPENCRWATIEEQQNNKRTNHFLTYNGKTQTISQWARELGIHKGTLFSRVRKGWNIEKVLGL